MLDACNVHNSKTVCIPNNVHTSINRYTDYLNHAANGTITTKYKWSTGDTGSFFLAVPFAESHMFQTGLNVGSQTVTLNGQRVRGPDKVGKINYPNPVYIDSSEKILIMRSSLPPGGRQCEITDATFDELAGI